RWRLVFLCGPLPRVSVIVGPLFIPESDRFTHLQEVKRAVRSGNRELVGQLLRTYDVDIDEVQRITVRQLFDTAGAVRRQISLLTIVWLSYASSWVATNVYITYWLVHYKGWSATEAGSLLLVSSGIGYFFYLLGGLVGEFFG